MLIQAQHPVAPQLVFYDRGLPPALEEKNMGKPEKADLLYRDKEYVKYYQLLRRAVADGRMDGKYPCKLCGMKYHTKQQAADCCKIPVV
jgi:hypothetical protein